MLPMTLGPSNKCVINIFKSIDECVFFDKDVMHESPMADAGLY